MDKYLFLDIDGVIATPRNVVDGLWELDGECQNHLDTIIKATQCKIVLSSSWRHNDVVATRAYMREKGFRLYNHIIGVTIRASSYIDSKKGFI